ncbi:MAG: HAMP domain-containing histidine kinase [Lachnospiraceae bacterium]|nr:HAMP domain-containing histidine kinase [Lachnospiraceae bacterium]
MDTKWKKWKIVLSMAAFFLGMSLLITNAITAGKLLSSWGMGLLHRSGDYQETGEFRWYVSNRLEELLSAAVGGNSWKNYGVAYSDEVWENKDQGYSFEETMAESGMAYEAEAEGISEISQEQQEVNDSTGYVENSYGASSWRNLREYMKEKAKDKNLQYALVYQKKLVYTNIEAWEGKTLKEWDGSDFYKSLDPEEYNFCLWFNKNGDGKVEISRNGWQEDVYGDGVYDDDSLWYVPGYSNFNVDDSTKDAVVFLAVTKNPKLYITGNYSDDGTVQYGEGLYYRQQQYFSAKKQFKICCAWLAVSIVLLLLSCCMRKYKRLGNQVVARFLGKLWMEFKVPFVLLFPPLFLFFTNQDAIREAEMILRVGGYWRDALYQMEQIVKGRFFILACFWLVYLIILDLRSNWGHLKKPLIDSLRTKELSYSVQKRLVRRYGLMLATGALSFMTVLLSFSLAFQQGNGAYEGDSPWYFQATAVWQRGCLILTALLSFLLLLCVIAGFAAMKKNRRLAEDIGALSDQIKAVKGGNLNKRLKLPEDADLRQTAENLNEIQHGLENALKEQMHSERMKVELVANVSHDIKTPLTSIISYVDLLKQEEELPEHVQEFIRILWEKSERLKSIVQDVFEVSKAASGQLPVQLEELDLGKLLRQTLADMDSQITESSLKMRTVIPEDPVLIIADGQRLYRVFQNLLQNALQYSLAGSRIFLSLTKMGTMHVVCIKNTSNLELEQGKDFTERFVRGDESRTDGGSGLGLSIAKSFTEACHGSFQVSMDGDLFTVTVSFPEIS